MQKDSLANKVALVTGGARRIGAAIVQTLHDAGMNIVLHYNTSEEEANHLCDRLNQKRPNSTIAFSAELQEPEIEKTFVEHAAKVWGRLDVLVNNASRFYRTPVGKVTEYAWDDLMNSNLKAPFFLAQAATPHLAKHNGTIINIVDIYAERPLLDYPVYCISKGALYTLTKVLAKELGAKKIRVNGVSPGQIMWPEGDNTPTDKEKKDILERIALNRTGDFEDIAKAVLFFVRDAGYVTGQILYVDGGRMLFG